MNTRCLFRILSVTHNYDGDAVIKWAPTHGNRDGKECQENKSFFKWTPSGSGELVIRPKSRAFGYVGAGGWLAAGEYVYLDLYDAGAEPPADEDALRTEWLLDKCGFGAGQGIMVRLLARSPGQDAPERNDSFNAGSSWAKGEIEMQVNNHHAFPAFALTVDEKGEIAQRRKTIDIRPA